ncbi:MAG: tyrosine-type recombinase/integrase [Syntrophomonadaceae bacterium]
MTSYLKKREVFYIICINFSKNLPNRWEDALELYLAWKRATGVSERTLDDYRDYVSRLYKKYPDIYRDEHELKKAVFDFMGKKVKPAYYNLKLAYLKGFLKWCVNEGIYSDNPLKDFRKKRAEGRIVNIDDKTLMKLIEMPDKSTFAGLRDYALIILSLDCGIRPKEAFSLLPSDFNQKAQEVYVRAEYSKTRISRTLHIQQITAEAIQQLLKVRHVEWDSNTPIFCTSDGRTLNRKSWAARLRIYSKSLDKKVMPYDLRHAFALGFLRNKGDSCVLQRILGHTSIAMTQRYLAITQADIKEQQMQASPLNNLITKKHRVRKI